jgi:PAS domain S-box-containing protein
MSATATDSEDGSREGVASLILDQLPVPVVVVDRSGDVSYTNQASKALLGSGGEGSDPTRPAVEGVTSLDGTQDNLGATMPLRRALEGDHYPADVMEAVDGRGGIHTVEVVATSILGDDGQVTSAAEVLWDITGHRAAGGDTVLLATIVESTDDAIISTDRHGLITSWNSGAEHLYGYGAEEMTGRPLSMIVLPGEPPIPTMEEVVAGRAPTHIQTQRRRKDGSVVRVAKSLSVLRVPGGQAMGLVHITRDISDQVEAELALAQTQRELEAQNRVLEQSNSDLEQFAYIASHDLSEPLRAVAGMVGLLARRYQGQLDQDADEFITFAVEGCERMRNMIEDLLKFSRAGRVELELTPVDLGNLVTTVVGALHHQIEDAGATVTVADLPVILADKTQLGQVVQNLISNAIKFRRPDVPSKVGISATKQGDYWKIEIADNGIGIDEAYRDRIFRMFQRLHPADAFPGTGIGLAISERIVNRHGGSIGVEGNSAGGSTFWLTVPQTPVEVP